MDFAQMSWLMLLMGPITNLAPPQSLAPVKEAKHPVYFYLFMNKHKSIFVYLFIYFQNPQELEGLTEAARRWVPWLFPGRGAAGICRSRRNLPRMSHPGVMEPQGCCA